MAIARTSGLNRKQRVHRERAECRRGHPCELKRERPVDVSVTLLDDEM